MWVKPSENQVKLICFSKFAELAELGQLGFTWFYLANSEKPIGTELTELGELGTERCLWVSVKYCTDPKLHSYEIYGLVVSVLITAECVFHWNPFDVGWHAKCSFNFIFFVYLVKTSMSLTQGFMQLSLSVGLAGLAAGFAVRIIGDVGVWGTTLTQQPTLFVGMVHCLMHLF